MSGEQHESYCHLQHGLGGVCSCSLEGRVEAMAIELHKVAYGGRYGFGHANRDTQEMFRRIARHVLGLVANR